MSFIVIVSNRGDEIDLTPGKDADDTKPRGAAAVLEGATAIQKDINRLKKWAVRTMKF